MDPDDPMDGLRARVADTLASNLLALPQPPQTQIRAPGSTPDFSALPKASDAPQDNCEFTFIGGAGTGGPYLDSFKTAFQKAGIQHVSVPNQAGPPYDPHGDAPIYRVAPDIASVPDVNDLGFARSLVGSPQIQAAAQHSRALGAEQYNIGGYSYGAAAAAANAYAIAENGGKVDNLVLLGAPINRDLYDAVRRHPNIKNVITMDLGTHGDPVHAGMSDRDFAASLPTLAAQWLNPVGEGHFYYGKSGPVGDERRRQLARTLVQDGLR